MTKNEKLIATILTKYAKGETLTKEDSALIDKLSGTPEQKQSALDLARDQPWQDEDKQDPNSVPSEAMKSNLKNYANKSKKVKPDSRAANRLRAKWLGIIVIVVMVAAIGLKLHNRSADKKPFTRETERISDTNNNGRTMLSGADGMMIAIDTMASGSQVRLDESCFIRKIDKHSYQLCGLSIGRMGILRSLKVNIDLGFVNLVYPDESRLTLELNAMYSWSSYRNSAHPDSMVGKIRFAIAKNTNSPWAIRLHDSTVIGDMATSFEIDAPTNRAAKVSLVSGSLMVKANKGTVILRPKQQVMIQNGQPIVRPLAVDTALWIWAKEPLTFNFKKASLDQTVRSIANYYRVVVYNPDHIPGIRVTAPIPSSKGLDFICKRITEIQSSMAYLRRSSDTIYITARRW